MTALPSWTRVGWAAHRRCIEVDGRQVHLVDLGEGPPLVLVHGLGGSWQTWLANLEALAAEHRVIAVDLPGFGASDPLPEDAPFDAHADSVQAVLAALRLERAVLVCHSMGGLVGVRLAADPSVDLAGLVLVNAGGVRLTPWRLRGIVAGFTAFNAVFALPGVASAFAARPRLRRALLRGMVADPRRVPAAQLREMLPLMAARGFLHALTTGAATANTVDPSSVRCPTLLLWGRDDRVLPLREAETLSGRIADAKLKVIDGAGHCPMFERPEAVDTAVLRFAASVSR